MQGWMLEAAKVVRPSTGEGKGGCDGFIKKKERLKPVVNMGAMCATVREMAGKRITGKTAR